MAWGEANDFNGLGGFPSLLDGPSGMCRTNGGVKEGDPLPWLGQTSAPPRTSSGSSLAGKVFHNRPERIDQGIGSRPCTTLIALVP